MSGAPPKAAMLADVARLRTANRYHAELTALAETVGVPLETAHARQSFLYLTLKQFGCSTIALPTPEGPVVARNMDWWPEDLLARASCLFRHQRDGRLDFARFDQRPCRVSHGSFLRLRGGLRILYGPNYQSRRPDAARG